MTGRRKEAKGGKGESARGPAAAHLASPEAAGSIAAPAASAIAPLPPAEMRMVALDRIIPSKNVRRRPDPARQAELTASVRQFGVLQPIQLRPIQGGGSFELVAGFCRLAAAGAAGLALIPATVREMTDLEALEIQLIENVQRSDLHPLEEAEGYQQLLKRGYDAARIAEKIGKSVAYVYDRVKLMHLGARARELFLDGVLTAGHAILLARIGEKEQARAFEDRRVIMEERLLFDPDGEDDADEGKASLKACSVRELQAWIDKHVRFDAKDVDPMLFPQTALDLTAAAEANRKVLAITFENYIPPEARDGKTYGPRSWKRADGLEKSKECEFSKIGYVAAGFRRGESFDVCVNKDRCQVHWAGELKRRRDRAAASEKAGGKPSAPREDTWAKQSRERQERQAREKAAYERIRPALLEAIVEKVKKAPTGGKSILGTLLLRAIRQHGMGSDSTIPNGSTADQLVRHAVWTWVRAQASGYSASDSFPRLAAELGVDVGRIRKETAPAKPKKAAVSKKKKRAAR